MKRIIGVILIAVLFGGSNFAGAALTDGLVAHYEFEGNTYDSSDKGNDGTAYGGLKYGAGKIGQAAIFDGVDDFINTGLRVADFVSKSMSLSAWVYLTSTNDAPTILGLTDHGNLGGIFLRLYTNNNTNLSSYNGSSWDQVYALSDQPSLSNWHHYAFTYDASTKNAIIYKNGSNIASGTIAGIYNFGSNVFTIANANSNSHFAGKIDELRIYDRALTISEIQQLAAAGTTPQPPPTPTPGKVSLMPVFKVLLGDDSWSYLGTYGHFRFYEIDGTPEGVIEGAISTLKAFILDLFSPDFVNTGITAVSEMAGILPHLTIELEEDNETLNEGCSVKPVIFITSGNKIFTNPGIINLNIYRFGGSNYYNLEATFELSANMILPFEPDKLYALIPEQSIVDEFTVTFTGGEGGMTFMETGKYVFQLDLSGIFMDSLITGSETVQMFVVP